MVENVYSEGNIVTFGTIYCMETVAMWHYCITTTQAMSTSMIRCQLISYYSNNVGGSLGSNNTKVQETTQIQEYEKV